jgi:hypothetical protein
MSGCEVRRLTDNTVLLRLSRSDQIANYETRRQHASLQWSTDFNPFTAHLEIHDRRILRSKDVISRSIGAGQKSGARDVIIKDVRRTAA